MRDFFEGVGTGDAAGIWEDVPQDRPEFREALQASRAQALAKQRQVARR